MAFLWGEAIPEAPPSRAPNPQAHLDHLLHRGSHDVIASWLEGGHRVHARDVERNAGLGIAFVDLTPAWMCDGLFVAKALCDAAVPFAFGESPFTAHLPRALRVPPIA
jgi:hypothetical protein